MRPVVLSERLQTVASMVTPGMRVCDVGCDHGFVSIWLVEQQVSPSVLAMDVREGPLGAAARHVAERCLESRIETRLSNGLHNYEAGEADSLICAGMGGRLMQRILEADKDKTDSFGELILQPQSELEQFRHFLRKNNYLIQEEEILLEDGKFYQVMRAVPLSAGIRDAGGGAVMETDIDSSKTQVMDGEIGKVSRIRWTAGEQVLPEKELCKLEERYGPVNLNKRTDVFIEYLRREERVYEEILDHLWENGLTQEKRRTRYAQVETYLRDCRKVQTVLYGGR